MKKSFEKLADEYFGKKGTKTRELFDNYTLQYAELQKEVSEVEKFVEKYNPYKNNTSIEREFINHVMFCIDNQLTPIKFFVWEQAQRLNEAKFKFPIGTKFTSLFSAPCVIKENDEFWQDSSGDIYVGDIPFEKLIYDSSSKKWAQIDKE